MSNGSKLKAARERKYKTPEQKKFFAGKIGVTPDMLDKFEKSGSKDNNLLERIARETGVPASKLV